MTIQPVRPFASRRSAPRLAATPSARRRLVAFGPFDDDFDPFEDEEESDVLLPLERAAGG
jgi:hypothetical protein